jgi:hypothetical protein
LQVCEGGVAIISFPVKPVTGKSAGTNVVRHMRNQFPEGSTVPGWACVADLKIIKKSCKELVALTDKHGWKKVLLPRPGCGAGELQWAEVKKVIEKYLDNRFVSVTY